MNRLFMLSVALIFSTSVFAQQPPPAPRDDGITITLNRNDLSMLQNFVNSSKLHMTMDDGTLIPLGNGTAILGFLSNKFNEKEAEKRRESPRMTPMPKPPAVTPHINPIPPHVAPAAH